MSYETNHYKGCTPIETINIMQGPQGMPGMPGPQGPRGPQGPPAAVPFLSLSAVGINFENESDDANTYVPVPYATKTQSGDTTSITPPTLPGDGEVTLEAGHTYYISFSTMGQVVGSGTTQTGKFRVLVNGQIVPDPVNGEWISPGGTFSHFWSITTTVTTTIQYQFARSVVDNFSNISIYATFLTIIQKD